jgi:hypothetical protein
MSDSTHKGYPRRPIPMMFKMPFCSVPVAVTCNADGGFFVFDNIPLGLYQRSLKWNTFHHASGFIVYGTNESFGIGIIKNNSSLFSFADVSFSEAFDVSDIDECEVLVSNVNTNIDNTHIIVSLACNYGGNILEATYSINIESILASFGEHLQMASEVDNKYIDKTISTASYSGSFGFSKISEGIVNGNLSEELMKSHIDALNTTSVSQIPAAGITDLCVFTREDTNFVVAMTAEAITIYDSEMNVLETKEISNELASRDNFIVNLIRFVPICNKKNVKPHYMIRLENTIYKRFFDFNKIIIQTYQGGDIKCYIIEIALEDAEDGENSGEAQMNSYTIREDSMPRESSKTDAEYGFYSESIEYNLEDTLFRFLDLKLESPLTDLKWQSSPITGIYSIAPIIAYS